MENNKRSGGKSFLVIAFCVVILLLCFYSHYLINQQTKVSMIQMAQWQSSIEEEYGSSETEEVSDEASEEVSEAQNAEAALPVMLEKCAELYAKNKDFVGWLSIADTKIDYPVMQTPGNESFYLDKDFDKKEDANGCLIMDTDSQVGDGTASAGYIIGKEPSDNLIIHGHTMKNGDMFGDLSLYADETYGKEHSVIRFDSLYESREYEVIAVFESEVFAKTDEVFKYYKFFEAETQEAFDDWYDNIKKMSLYDTGVTAEFGDEFITLSCCAYHTENGRFVVVGKRIR